jgi:hypothetical protein
MQADGAARIYSDAPCQIIGRASRSADDQHAGCGSPLRQPARSHGQPLRRVGGLDDSKGLVEGHARLLPPGRHAGSP